MTTVLTDDYLAFCRRLRALCGIDLAEYKRPQMERRLRAHFARHGIENLLGAIPGLRRDPRALDALLDRITINVSQLWRNPEQWELIARSILPTLPTDRPLLAWSAGSSYGAEAYTLAALCRATIPQARMRILGTDIDPRVIERAKQACFDAADARTAPADLLRQHFEPTANGGWIAKPPLRAMTRFEVGDLLRIKPEAQSYDLVLCRNTVIYFDDHVRNELHARLAASLRPGGVMVIGATERIIRARSLALQPVHPFIFRKT